jgi:hypothetical protein
VECCNFLGLLLDAKVAFCYVTGSQLYQVDRTYDTFEWYVQICKKYETHENQFYFCFDFNSDVPLHSAIYMALFLLTVMDPKIEILWHLNDGSAL